MITLMVVIVVTGIALGHAVARTLRSLGVQL